MNIPTNLPEAIAYLLNTIPPKKQDKIMENTEEDFIVASYKGIGATIRSEWGLWEGENDLVKWFESIGIDHPDDMSVIILTSTYRTLKSLPIDLDGQVKKCKDYWEKNG